MIESKVSSSKSKKKKRERNSSDVNTTEAVEASKLNEQTPRLRK